MISSTFCRVCGYDFGVVVWGESDETPMHGYICPCCGAQVGLEDINYRGVQLYRTAWLENGAKWFQPRERPEDWDLFEQLKSIPDRFR